MKIIILIFWLHFLADFVFQSRNVANNKSTNIKILALHCLIYSLPFLILGWKFAVYAGLSHFPVDYITSKLTTKYYKQERNHAFFTTIGADQAIHLTILVYIANHYFPTIFT